MASRRGSAGQQDLVVGDPSPPEYKRPFSARNSLKLYQEYQEYERLRHLAQLASRGRSVQSPLLFLSQLLPKAIRICLADTFFSGPPGGFLQESDLTDCLAKHAECTGEDIDPVVTAVERRLSMGLELTALDRIDAIKGRMEDYFEDPCVEQVFRDSAGKYHYGPARVIAAALVAGLKPPEFKLGVERALKSKGGWKEDPRAVFQVVRAAALEWRVVESADKRRDQARGKKPVAGRTGGSQQQQSSQQKPRPSNRRRKSKGKPGPGSGSTRSRESGSGPGMSAARPPANQRRSQEKLRLEDISVASSTSAHADTTTKKACLNPKCQNEATHRCSHCEMVWFCGLDCQTLLWDSHEFFCISIAKEPEAAVLLLDGMGYLGPGNFFTKAVEAGLARAGAKVATVDVSKKPGTFDQVGYVLSEEVVRFTSCIALYVGSAHVDAEKEFAKNMNFREKLRGWVARGGRLIIHGENSGLMGNWPQWFGKTWDCSAYTRTTQECRAKSSDDVHWCKWYPEAKGAVTKSMLMKAVLMSGVPKEETLFSEELDVDEDLDVEERLEAERRLEVAERRAAVVLGRSGDGTVSFFGSVNAEEDTCAIMAVIARGPR